MASSPDNSSDLDYADVLWQAADKLRGTVDAAEYKHVVLGLLFLKYISDSFESRRDKLKEELEKDGIKGQRLEKMLEDRDEYTAERVFWVPPEARWQNLQNQAARPDIATLIDDAILAVERDNPNLKNKLPRDYDDGEPFAHKFPRLVAELEEHFAEIRRIESNIRKQLRGLAWRS